MKATAPPLPTPVAVFGPDARAGREGCFGVLLGVRRASWIDVVRVTPIGGRGSLSRAVEARFAAYAPWDAVGIAVPHRATRGRTQKLLEALVPGDLLSTEKEVLFHAGDRFTRARLDRRGV